VNSLKYFNQSINNLNTNTMNTQNQIIALTESFLNGDLTSEEFNTQVRILENN